MSDSIEKLSRQQGAEQGVASAALDAAAAQRRARDGELSLRMASNNLTYTLPQSANLVVTRQMVHYPFDRTSYADGANARVFLNNGAEYVYGKNSYLTFGVRALAPGAAVSATFASSSAAALIETMVLTSDSGVEVERLEHVNLWANTSHQYGASMDWIHNYGSVMGYEGETDVRGVGNPAYVASTNLVQVAPASVRFVIPMSKISGLFNSGKLLPAHLMAGMRLDIKLASAAEALTYNAAEAAPSYIIENPELVLDQYMLTDSALRVLDEMSASQGLVLPFATYDHSQSTPTTTAVNHSVTRAVSRSINVFAKSRVPAAVTDAALDSLACEAANPFASFQWSLGSIHFPNKRLDNPEEMYNYAQILYSQQEDDDKPNAVSFNKYSAGQGIAAANLERSTVLALTGLSVSSARQLQLSATLTNANRFVDVFMGYVRVLDIFINKIIVRE